MLQFREGLGNDQDGCREIPRPNLVFSEWLVEVNTARLIQGHQMVKVA